MVGHSVLLLELAVVEQRAVLIVAIGARGLANRVVRHAHLLLEVVRAFLSSKTDIFSSKNG
jgi:hypothetical protein